MTAVRSNKEHKVFVIKGFTKFISHGDIGTDIMLDFYILETHLSSA